MEMFRRTALLPALVLWVQIAALPGSAATQIFTDRAAFEAALLALGHVSESEGFEDTSLPLGVQGVGYIEQFITFGPMSHDYGAFAAATDSSYGIYRQTTYTTEGSSTFAWDAGHVLGIPPFSGLIALEEVVLDFDAPLLAWGADVIDFGEEPISDYLDPPPAGTTYALEFTGADLVDQVIDTALWTVNDSTQCPPANPGCTEPPGNVQFFGVISDAPFTQVRLRNTGVRFDTSFGDIFNDETFLDRMLTARACPRDFDGDGVVDPAVGCEVPTDNCPSAPNPGQEDADGDGIGDACQCGDLDGDGFVSAAPGGDVQRIQEARLSIGPPLTTEEQDRCAVHPDLLGCGLAQAVVIQRGAALLGPGLAPSCVAAMSPPVHLWPFHKDASDVIGGAAGTLMNGAVVSTGALALDGIDDYARTGPTHATLDQKTLVTWAALDNLSQRSGSTLTVQDPTGTDVFDAIVFGEQLASQWMNGSDFLMRTVPGDNGGPLETQTDPTDVMMAISYDAVGGIVLRRDGVEYARHSAGTPVSFPAGVADFVLGLRHEDAAGAGGTATGMDPYLAGSIEEARVYPTALSAAQVAALHAQGPLPLDPAVIGAVSLWYDAADVSTLDLGSGQSVLEWRDKGPFANHLSSPSAAERPVKLAGSPGMLEFDGVDDHLCGTGLVDLQSAGFSIFVVARNDVRKSYQGIFSLRASLVDNADLEVYWQAGTSGAGSGNLVYASNRRLGPAGFFLNVNSPPAFGNDYVASILVTSDTAPGQLRINGGALANSNTNPGDYFPNAALPPCVGYGVGTSLPGNTLDGRFGELLVFSSVLSAADRTTVEQYLIDKWGID